MDMALGSIRVAFTARIDATPSRPLKVQKYVKSAIEAIAPLATATDSGCTMGRMVTGPCRVMR
jgi:hypothetical protein